MGAVVNDAAGSEWRGGGEDRSCRSTLRDWATANGVFIPLDDYYESAFLEGGRRSTPIELSSRGLSVPTSGRPHAPTSGVCHKGG